MISGSNAGIMFSFLFIIFITFLIMLSSIILCYVCMWKIFEKCGVDSYKAFIPFYNLIILLGILNMDWWHVLIYLFVPYSAIVYSIVFLIKLSNLFGKSLKFKILLIVFTPVFLPILAFGDSKYIGFEK